MDSMTISFEESFASRLPLELRQMVYHWATMGNSDDIEIISHRDKVTSPEPSALDFLARLKKSYPSHIYDEAIQYLTRSKFRWVFTSDSYPHRYLLSRFYRTAPLELRNRIQNVYLRRVRMVTVINPSGFFIDTNNHLVFRLPRRSDYSEYLQRIDKKGSRNVTAIMRTYLYDMALGMAMLPRSMPSLKKLDIGLDVLDCSWDNFRCPPLAFLRQKIDRDASPKIAKDFTILHATLPLKDLKTISELDIRVFWGDYLGLGDVVTWGEDTKRPEYQETFIQAFREVVPAKSITSHVE